MTTPVSIMPVPITGLIGCCVPILPGTEGEWDHPLEQRTELCAVDANWIVGMVPTCDVHLKTFCEEGGIDWPGVVAETQRKIEDCERPWTERKRHSQAVARDNHAHFIQARDLSQARTKGNGR